MTFCRPATCTTFTFLTTMTTSARRRTRQFLLPDGGETNKREDSTSFGRKRSQSLPLIIILGVIGYVLLVEDGGSSSSSANLRRQLKVQNTGIRRQRQKAAAAANGAARGRGKQPAHRRASASLADNNSNNRQLEAQAERSEAEQTNRQLGEGLNGSAKDRRKVRSKKRELFGISFLGNSDKDKVDDDDNEDDELDELMDSNTVDADPDLQEALEALEETSSAGPPPDEMEDNSTPEGLMDDQPFEYIQVPREHEHAHQDSEVLPGQPGLSPEFNVDDPLGSAFQPQPFSETVVNAAMEAELEAEEEIIEEIVQEEVLEELTEQQPPQEAEVLEEVLELEGEIEPDQEVIVDEAVPGDCKVLEGLLPTKKIAPTFAASYPGSGAKMSWNLITGLTGIQTGDDHRINEVAWDESITVKTHYPHKEGNPNIGSMMEQTEGEPGLKFSFPRAFVMIRHPMNAIPGYHNYLYEQKNGLAGHSTRAPLDEWLQWRNANFEEEMQSWIDHTSYWVEHYGSEYGGMSTDGEKVERQILSYEGMVSNAEGPANALALARFLDWTVGIEATTDPGTVDCVWEKVIKYKGKDPNTSEVKDPESERSGDKYRPYTSGQLDHMIQKLEELASRHPNDKQLGPILDVYIATAYDAQNIAEEREKAEQRGEEPMPIQPAM